MEIIAAFLLYMATLIGGVVMAGAALMFVATVVRGIFVREGYYRGYDKDAG